VADRSVRVVLKVLVDALFEFEGGDGGVHRGERADDRGGGTGLWPCLTSAGWRSCGAANTVASRSASLRRRVRAAAARVHGADTTVIWPARLVMIS
jgi:hypothetical protein